MAIVAASRFPPLGTRGFGSTYSRDAFGWKTDREYLEKANQEILVGVIIETRKGAENAQEIIDTPGIGECIDCDVVDNSGGRHHHDR